jgi:hypothetical protein
MRTGLVMRPVHPKVPSEAEATIAPVVLAAIRRPSGGHRRTDNMSVWPYRVSDTPSSKIHYKRSLRVSVVLALRNHVWKPRLEVASPAQKRSVDRAQGKGPNRSTSKQGLCNFLVSRQLDSFRVKFIIRRAGQPRARREQSKCPSAAIHPAYMIAQIVEWRGKSLDQKLRSWGRRVAQLLSPPSPNAGQKCE